MEGRGTWSDGGVSTERKPSSESVTSLLDGLLSLVSVVEWFRTAPLTSGRVISFVRCLNYFNSLLFREKSCLRVIMSCNDLGLHGAPQRQLSWNLPCLALRTEQRSPFARHVWLMVEPSRAHVSDRGLDVVRTVRSGEHGRIPGIERLCPRIIRWIEALDTSGGTPIGRCRGFWKAPRAQLQ